MLLDKLSCENPCVSGFWVSTEEFKFLSSSVQSLPGDCWENGCDIADYSYLKCRCQYKRLESFNVVQVKVCGPIVGTSNSADDFDSWIGLEILSSS